MSGFIVQGPKSDYRDRSGLKNGLYPSKYVQLLHFEDIFKMCEYMMLCTELSVGSMSVWNCSSIEHFLLLFPDQMINHLLVQSYR